MRIGIIGLRQAEIEGQEERILVLFMEYKNFLNLIKKMRR